MRCFLINFRFRLVDEFVSEGLPGSKRNRSPISVERAPPKCTIQMKATVDEELMVKKARGISSSSTKSYVAMLKLFYWILLNNGRKGEGDSEGH